VGELSVSVKGAIELTGILDRYGVASGFASWALKKKLSTRFDAKPNWFI
jgi:hypothetical protein